MRIHFPDRYEAHRIRDKDKLTFMAKQFGLTYEQFEANNWKTDGVNEMSEIDDNVPVPVSFAEAPAAPAKRGRPPKAALLVPGAPKAPRKPRSGGKASQAANLEAALAFIAPFAKPDLLEASNFVNLSNKMATSYNGQIAAGHPIEEELNVSPNLTKLRAALARTGKTLVITETSNLSLAIQGERLRAVIPCLPVEELGQMQPDPPQIFNDFDLLKQAFKACCALSDEKATRVIETSLLLQPNICTSTNGHSLIQFWHGFDQLPPDIVLPKSFALAVANCPLKIVGLGGTWNAEQGVMSSFTVCFENGAWYKTQTYFDRWPDLSKIIDLPSQPETLPEGFFEGVEALSKFTKENNAIYLQTDLITTTRPETITDNTGASYTVKGLNTNLTLNAELLLKLAPFMQTVDFTSNPKQVMFFSDKIRGTLMVMT